jgi:hypothetical protein
MGTMAKKIDRSSTYYLERLQREHPKIHSDWMAGKYPSINAARRAAGMITGRTRLHELKNAWAKASPAERRQFLSWATSTTAGSTVRSPAPSRPIAVDQQIEPWAAKRIDEIMTKRNMKLGAIMDELGYSRLDASLGNALKNGTRIRPGMVTALEKWLSDNRTI